MKSIFGFCLVAALTGIAAISGAAPQYKDGELLFKLKDGFENAPTVIGLAAMGATEMERYPQIGWVRVRYNTTGRTINQAITSLKRLNFVSVVEKNLIRKWMDVPNDSQIGQQWVVNRIKLPEAWDLTHGDPAVKLGILDSGVELTHPDLAGKILPGRDVVDDDNDVSDTDGVGHGTHVSGIASAATNNGLGVAGTGYDCMILPVRVGGAFGISGADIIEGITWATDNGANVINMSLGGFGSSQAEQDACTYARTNEVLVCASAGNHGTTTKSYPAAYVGVMAVAASDPDDSRSSFSAFGNWVHVTAPGSQILSTVMGGGYEAWDGTSMSCPVVTGLAGLVWSRGGTSQSSQRVFDIICDNCDPVPGNYTINGRVNAYESVLHTVIVQQTHLSMISASMFVGLQENGSITDLEDQDGVYYNVTTQVLGRAGSQGGIEMQVQLDRPANELFDFKFNFATKSNINSTAMFWLWNNVTNKWDFIKAFPTKVAGSTGFALVKNMGKYLDADGVAIIRLRGHNPSGKPGGNFPFTFGVDFAELEASYEVQP